MGYTISILITFLISPFLVRSLGDAQYGVLALVAEITSYYGLADLGIRGAVGYFVARHSANKDLDALRKTVHNAIWILVPTASGIVLIGCAIAYFSPQWFKLGGVSPSDLQKVILITSTTFAIGLPCAILSAILYGLRRLDLTTFTDVFQRILTGVLAFVTIETGGGLVEFAIAQGAASLARAALEAVVVRRLGFTFPVFPPHPVRARIRELLSYGVRSTTIQFSQMIVSQLHLIVIATFLAANYVTPFAIARSLVVYYSLAITTITRSLTPQFTYLNELKQHDEVIRVYLRVSRLTALLGTWVAAGIIVFSKPFLGLWMGQRFVEGDVLFRSDVIAVLLTVGAYWRVLQSGAYQVLAGTLRLRFLTTLNVIEAAANLSLSLVLLHFLGLVGVALGTVLPQVVAYGVVMPAYMIRTYRLPWGAYAGNVWRPALIAGLAMGLPGWFMVQHWNPRNLIQLAVEGAASSAICFLVCYTLELTKEDRQNIKSKLRLGG